MGNPFIVADDEKPPFGIRHCSMCKSCEELVYRHGRLGARCSFLRIQPDPEDGCARWQLDPEALGEEGAGA